MSNLWTDQPHDADGDTLLVVNLGDAKVLQIQSVTGPGEGLYSGTVGNLFGSKTIVGSDLAVLLRDINRQIGDGKK